jgi:beta-lactamase regulating signal transducer with metallopeptidase domain
MREQSLQVRESAAEQLEERQSDWAYSRPVVVLDLVWNLAFVIVAAVVLFLSQEERPKTNLRLWIVGYAAQCLVHMICVFAEFKRRRRRSGSRRNESNGNAQTQIAGVTDTRPSNGGEAGEPAR